MTNENVKLSVITPEQAMEWWPTIVDYLSKGDQYAISRYSAYDLKERIKDGTVLIMVAWDPKTAVLYGVFAAEGAEYPRKKVFAIILAGGDEIWRWAHLWPAFEYVAKEMGFDQIEVVGRRGWKRFISAPEVATVFVKELL